MSGSLDSAPFLCSLVDLCKPPCCMEKLLVSDNSIDTVVVKFFIQAGTVFRVKGCNDNNCAGTAGVNWDFP